MTLKGSKQSRRPGSSRACFFERGRAVFSKKGFSQAPSTASAEPGLAEKLSGSLLVYCAAGGQGCVAEVARLFEARRRQGRADVRQLGAAPGPDRDQPEGRRLRAGGCGLCRHGKERGLTGGIHGILSFHSVIYVPKGTRRDPRGERSRAARLRLALADESSAIGKLQKGLFKEERHGRRGRPQEHGLRAGHGDRGGPGGEARHGRTPVSSGTRWPRCSR